MKIKESKSGSIMLLDNNEVLQHILPVNYYVHKHPTIYNAVLISSSSDDMDVQNGIVVRLSEVTQIGNDTFKISLSSLMKKLSDFSTKIYPHVSGRSDEYAEFMAVSNFEELLSFCKKYGKKEERFKNGKLESRYYSCSFSDFSISHSFSFRYRLDKTNLVNHIHIGSAGGSGVGGANLIPFKEKYKLFNYDENDKLIDYSYLTGKGLRLSAFLKLKNIDEFIAFLKLYGNNKSVSMSNGKIFEEKYYISEPFVFFTFRYSYVSESSQLISKISLSGSAFTESTVAIPFSEKCKQFNYDANGKLTSTEYINC